MLVPFSRVVAKKSIGSAVKHPCLSPRRSSGPQDGKLRDVGSGLPCEVTDPCSFLRSFGFRQEDLSCDFAL